MTQGSNTIKTRVAKIESQAEGIQERGHICAR